MRASAGDVTLLHGDCLELMRDIPDGSVDMVLCDLPYGITQNKWDKAIPFAPLWEQYHRVCKPNAAVLLFGQMPFSARLCLSNPKEFRYEWVCEKSNPTGFLNANKMPLKCHEQALVFYRSLPLYNPQLGKGKRYRRQWDHTSSNYNAKAIVSQKSEYPENARFPRDVIPYRNCSWGPDKGLHPTQKPVALLEYLIRTYTNEGETVLDNCMGSGSTGVACINTGRRFIGIELDDHYFDVARKRIEEEGEQDGKEDTADHQ